MSYNSNQLLSDKGEEEQELKKKCLNDSFQIVQDENKFCSDFSDFFKFVVRTN